MTHYKIIHIDMDSFYAAIEMRDNPSLRALPIAVGGSAQQRGVICTSNYKAREYGIRSAMATAQALRLCPNLVVLPVNMSKYRTVATTIRQIFYEFTALVEPISLDEAYLDVTDCRQYSGSGTWIAKAIRKRIHQRTGLTASAGVAPNKFLAKIASEWHKPNGLYVITPAQVNKFVAALPIDKIIGVGKVTTKKLHDLNIYHCSDLQKIPLNSLTKTFGSFGKRLHELSFGIDNRLVEANRLRKSLSVEQTFPTDITEPKQVDAALELLFIKLKERLANYLEYPIQKQFLKIKFQDFTRTTIERGISSLSVELFKQLFQQGYERKQLPIRLIGIGIHFASAKYSAESQICIEL
jgi:DNA polymerase IV